MENESQTCFIGCSFIHSRSASFMRVCHPLPVALKAAKTSKSNRTVCEAFVWPAGRPRRTSLVPSIRSAFSNQLSVNSGASSGSTKVFFVTADFAVICVPHRNYSAGVFSCSPDNHNHPAIQYPNGDEAFLAVVRTIIESDKMKSVKKPCRNQQNQDLAPPESFLFLQYRTQ